MPLVVVFLITFAAATVFDPLAYADSQFPTTFLDIAGTYAYQEYDVHCASFRPPPNLLTLELASEEDVAGGNGKVLHYTGTLDYYESPVIRPDCASMDRSIPCGFQPLVDGRCGLGGNRLTVSGAMQWEVVDSVFGPQVRWSIPQEFLATREDGVEGPLPGGVQGPYFNADAIRLSLLNSYGFGARADLGEVSQLGAIILLTGASAGPDSICTCQARSPDDRIFCCVGDPYFRKVAGNAKELDVFADVVGTLRSTLPTLTQTDREVHRARLRLLRQDDGYVRAQNPGESDQDYADYLATKTFTPVAEQTIERASDGTDKYGSPGRYVFKNVRVFHAADRGGRRVWYPAAYTVEIRSAQTDEFVLDPDTMQPIPGKAAPLHFAPAEAHNLVPGSPSGVETALTPLFALEAKQSLVDRLTERCSLNYGPIEQGAAAYLQQLRSGALETTVERDEGLQRAIWAERSINGSVALASELFDISLTGLGTLLADAFADLTDFASAKLSAAKKRVDAIDSTPPSAVPPGFNADKLNAAQKRAAADAQRIVDDADMADSLKATIKALKPLVEIALVKSGVSPSTAASLAGNYTLVMAAVFSGIQSGTLLGGAVPLIKKAIEEAVKLAKPALVDGVDASYCKSTRNALSFSVDTMQSWNTSNDAAFRIHRQNVVRTIGQMNDEASETIALLGALIEVAGGLDTVQDAASVISKAVKWVKVVEETAAVMKYGFNANAAVTPLIVIYTSVNDLAIQGAYQAYGQIPPALRAEARSTLARSSYRAGARLQLDDAQPMLDALAAVRTALAADDIGTTVERIADQTAGSYRAERDRWTGSVRAYLAQAMAVDPTMADTEVGEAIGQTYVEQVELFRLEAELDDALTDLFEQVLTGRYASTTDPLYVARRNRTLTYFDVVAEQVGMLKNALDLLDFELSLGLQFQPAVLVETVSVTSDDTGQAAISSTPEVFTVRARLRNVSDTAVADVGARLTITSPSDAIVALDALDKAAGTGTLAADDAVDGSGADEAEVVWQVRYEGDYTPEVVAFDVDALEAGDTPTSFFTVGSQALLPLDPSVGDTDLDTLPDAYETDHGLAVGTDDADADADGDGLSNRAEFELGTDPKASDSDMDGISDGDEFQGASGFVTDPLDPDSDDDGTSDGSDGAPLDGGSTTAPPPADEPAVAVSQASVALTSTNRMAFVTVSNAGTGTLEWTATPDDPALIQASPVSPDRRAEGTSLSVTVPAGFDFESSAGYQTHVVVADVAGLVRDTVEVVVNVVGDTGASFCGRPTATSVDDPITATDALYALRAAVSLVVCELCRCDVDNSGTVAASDALAILKKAVGVDVPLVCPAC